MINILKKKRTLLTAVILIGLIITTILVSLNIGSFKVQPIEVLKTLIGQGTRSNEIVILNIRLPRIIIAVLVGIALSTAGAILQCVTKND